MQSGGYNDWVNSRGESLGSQSSLNTVLYPASACNGLSGHSANFCLRHSSTNSRRSVGLSGMADVATAPGHAHKRHQTCCTRRIDGTTARMGTVNAVRCPGANMQVRCHAVGSKSAVYNSRAPGRACTCKTHKYLLQHKMQPMYSASCTAHMPDILRSICRAPTKQRFSAQGCQRLHIVPILLYALQLLYEVIDGALVCDILYRNDQSTLVCSSTRIDLQEVPAIWSLERSAGLRRKHLDLAVTPAQHLSCLLRSRLLHS